MAEMVKEFYYNNNAFTTTTNLWESLRTTIREGTSREASMQTNSIQPGAIVIKTSAAEQEAAFLSIRAWSWTTWMAWMQTAWTVLSDEYTSRAACSLQSVATWINYAGCFLNFNKQTFTSINSNFETSIFSEFLTEIHTDLLLPNNLLLPNTFCNCICVNVYVV